MKHLNLFIKLTRLNKPIGYMLLFWPCLWGLTLVYNFNEEIIITMQQEPNIILAKKILSK